MALSRCTKIFYGLAILLVTAIIIGLIAVFVKKDHQSKWPDYLIIEIENISSFQTITMDNIAQQPIVQLIMINFG